MIRLAANLVEMLDSFLPLAARDSVAGELIVCRELWDLGVVTLDIALVS
jgi:hypothetical protein